MTEKQATKNSQELPWPIKIPLIAVTVLVSQYLVRNGIPWTKTQAVESKDAAAELAAKMGIDKRQLLSPTGQYWLYMHIRYYKGTQDATKSPERVVEIQRDTARYIESLSTVGVDPVAIEFGLQTASLLRDVASMVEHRGSSAALVESIARGLNNDWFGPYLDSVDENSDMRTRVRAWEDNRVRARAFLSRQYGFEMKP